MRAQVGLDNYMTHAVTGTTARSFAAETDMGDTELLQLAKEMLLAFPFVGITVIIAVHLLHTRIHDVCA